MEADARIIDVVQTLDDPVEYVRGVVGSFFAYHFDAEKAVVRIGTSGKENHPKLLHRAVRRFHFNVIRAAALLSRTKPQGDS